MIQGIDHLVIACADPNAAAAEVESAIGLTFTGGGRHPGAGTWNRIAWLADGSYLELIGIADAEAAAGSPIGSAAARVLTENGAGLATYALRVDDLEATVSALRAAGSEIGLTVHGERRRDDGEVVEWWTALPDAPLAPDAPPFLIQHAYAGQEWGPDAMAARAELVHPIGSPVVMTRLDLAADDPPTTAAAVHEAVAVDFWAVADLAVADVGPHVIRFVPRREMAVPAVITLGASVDAPRTVDLLGLRFDVERVELALRA